ncbi:hypothetical protein C8R43DRAFT_977301 [Mycena crocata]|nr:hypothetical protein C8R43DRAFT_977301 [Mycena crocata]
MNSSFDGGQSCRVANPDISGLGVRISFYLQTIALVLLAGRNLEEALNSVWTLLGTSFGLTISALVTAVQNDLPLYQAIIVTDLIWLSNFAIFMGLATYNRHPRGSHTIQYAAIVQTYISMSCILYLWARAAKLEFDAHEGRTVFVVLFVSTLATGRGRTIALAITSILLVGYSGVATLFVYRHLPFWRAPEQQHKDKPIPLQVDIPPSPMSIGSQNRLPANRPPPSLAVDPHLMTLSLFFGIPYVITVACTELQIRRNPLCADNTFWGFGQILAMTVSIVPVVITVKAFHKHGLKQRARVRGPGEGNFSDV